MRLAIFVFILAYACCTVAGGSGGYEKVTSGSTCMRGTRVTSKEECVEAAKQLGLSDKDAVESSGDWSDWPPYCFAAGGGVYFNTNGDATSMCNSEDRICICNEPGMIEAMIKK